MQHLRYGPPTLWYMYDYMYDCTLRFYSSKLIPVDGLKMMFQNKYKV